MEVGSDQIGLRGRVGAFDEHNLAKKQSKPAFASGCHTHHGSTKITVVLLVNRRFGAIEKVSNCSFE